jgi:hypothetical protein
MPSLEDALKILEFLFERKARLEVDRKEILNSPLSEALRDDQDAKVKRLIEEVEEQKKSTLADLVRIPPFHYARHSQFLAPFEKKAPYDKSIFIMTKFPEGNDPVDQELRAVIKAVEDAITECGYVPRIASAQDFHQILWDNVELYLLGCCRGVAIVESKYRSELNPNVAMEWGWMRGMGRSVLYLVEDSFQLARADWGGLIEYRFPWNNPKDKIREAVRKWLGVDSGE